MSSAASSLAAAATTTDQPEVSLLDQLVSEGRFSPDVASQQRGKDMVKEFVNQVLEGQMTLNRDADASIAARIAQLDRIISIQLNEVMHHPSFQKLEATWRGIKYLLDQSETNDSLKIKVLNVSKKDLLRDLQRASEFDQSAMFKKVYEEEFGVFGGAPFAALVGDYEFSRGPEDMELLEKVAQVASAAHAPFLSAASPELMNLSSYTQLGAPRDLSKVFDSTEYAKWKSFRQSDDSRYVALTLPHILMRDPYGKETRPVDAFDYEEDVDGKDPPQVPVGQRGLWSGSAADQLARQVRLVCSHSRRGKRRTGGRADGTQFQYRRRRRGAEVPDRGVHHRPAREGTGRSRPSASGALQGH